MEYTQEAMQQLFQRAAAYSQARYNNEPDRIEIDSDGSIRLVYETYCCGSYDTDYEYVDPEQLTEDLDVVAARRKEEEERKKKEAEERRKREEEARAIREREERKQQYLRLKREFE